MAPSFSPSKLLLVLLATAGSVVAQPAPDEEQRRSLIADAEAARDVGLHEQALAHALRAGQMRWTPSLHMLVAQEHLALLHGVDALEHATRCLVGAEADPTVRYRARIVEQCRVIIDLMTPQVGRLQLLLPPSLPSGLRLRVGGRVVPRADWSAPFTVMAGAVTIDADGEGVTALRATVNVFAGALSELRLRLSDPPPPPPAPPPDGAVRGPSDRPSSPR